VESRAQPEHLLIDGYNVIRATSRFHRQERVGLGAARQGLQQALIRYAQRTGARVTLVFDGDEGVALPLESAPQDPVQVVFSHPPAKADDLIKKAVQHKHGARRVRVVTSDREIRRFAQRHKIRSTPADEFVLEELDDPPARPPADPPAVPPEVDPDLALDEEEVNIWERLFREGREDPSEE